MSQEIQSSKRAYLQASLSVTSGNLLQVTIAILIITAVLKYLVDYSMNRAVGRSKLLAIAKLKLI